MTKIKPYINREKESLGLIIGLFIYSFSASPQSTLREMLSIRGFLTRCTKIYTLSSVLQDLPSSIILELWTLTLHQLNYYCYQLRINVALALLEENRKVLFVLPLQIELIRKGTCHPPHTLAIQGSHPLKACGSSTPQIDGQDQEPR